MELLFNISQCGIFALKQIRNDILSILQNIPVDCPGSLNQINAVLRSTISVKDELDVDCLVSFLTWFLEIHTSQLIL